MYIIKNFSSAHDLRMHTIARTLTKDSCLKASWGPKTLLYKAFVGYVDAKGYGESREILGLRASEMSQTTHAMARILGGSWVVIKGLISRVTILITHIGGLITPLMTMARCSQTQGIRAALPHGDPRVAPGIWRGGLSQGRVFRA